MEVSIIIPVYNTPAALLEECFSSILRQTYRYCEVIFIDDKSTNPETLNTLNALKEQHPFCKLITLNENKRVPFAINKGLEESKNEIIIRMDSDDIMLPERIEKQVNYIVDHPEVDILGAQMQHFDQNVSGEIRLLGAPTRHPRIITREYAKNQPTNWILNHPTVAFRKSRIQLIGGYDSTLVNVAEDAELWYRALRHDFIIHNLSDVLLMYRVHQDQNRHKSRGINNSIFLAKLRESL